MSDERWNPRTPPPAATRRPSEPLWNVRHNHITWSTELRFQGESYGWETTILRDGELFVAHGAFPLKGDAIRWAEEQQQEAERGWLE